MSGYADSAAIDAALGNAPLLRKPFDMNQLADAIAAALERGSPLAGSTAAPAAANPGEAPDSSG